MALFSYIFRNLHYEWYVGAQKLQFALFWYQWAEFTANCSFCALRVVTTLRGHAVNE